VPCQKVHEWCNQQVNNIEPRSAKGESAKERSSDWSGEVTELSIGRTSNHAFLDKERERKSLSRTTDVVFLY